MKKLLLISLSIVLVFACVMLAACGDCANGHTFGEWHDEVAANCTNAGTKGYKECAVCHKYFDANGKEIADLVIPSIPTAHVSVAVDAVAATCTKVGYTAGHKCSVCNIVLDGVEEVDALGHDFDETKLNYVTYTACSRCDAYKVLESKNIYDEDFVYDFNDEKQAEIDCVYDELTALLDGTSAKIFGEDFDEKFEVYDDFVSYVQYQYQVARVLNDISYTAETQDAFSSITEYYYNIIAKYYGLFQLIYDSEDYNEYFYKDWTQAEIDEVLALAASYDAENRTEAEKITEEYEDWFAGLEDLNNPTDKQKLELCNLYNKLVIANNNIATKAGYNNYMGYAYANVYERDYAPADVANMREFVRNYIAPILADISEDYLYEYVKLYYEGWSLDEDAWYYSTYKGYYVLRDLAEVAGDADRINAIVQSRQSLSDYYAFLSDSKFVDDQHDSFSKALSDLFENGNYFTGVNENVTAYTWFIYKMELPMLLFTSEYRDSFTFVHEFGHYYQFIYNGNLSVPMDHDETQSQGNEMLYLAWLKAHLPAGVSEGFTWMELEQLFEMLGTIVQATAVDEFEYLVYTGATTFNGKPIAMIELSDGTQVVDYWTLYEDVMSSYWSGMGDYFYSTYWAFVVFDQAAYYISYAMSALPCLELYAIAGTGTDGLEKARDSYLKLFTFGSNEEFVDFETYTDENGEIYTEATLKEGVTYENILNWAGLKGPFQEELYQTIQQFFAARS